MQMPTIDSRRDLPFAFHTDGLATDGLRVFRIEGREQMNQPFRFEVTLVAESASLDLHARIGQPATLTIKGQSQSTLGYRREIHGRIERFMQISASRRYSQYQATLAPTLFPLAYTRNSRVFRELSTAEIVEKVLTDGCIPNEHFQFLLHAQYGKRDFCVQYQESDLAFISRLLEEEGIFYFFRHEDGNDIMVLGDGPHAIEAAPHASHLAYRDHPHLYEEVIHSVRAEARFRPGSTVLRDFRFKHPGLDMEARQASSDFTDYQVYYFPGEFVEPALGQRLAKIRHEEIQGERSQISAESNSPALLPGHVFQLEGYGRHDMSRGYLLVSVEHDGVQPQVLGEEHVAVPEQQYKSQITCIPDDVTYRPPRITPRPCILGIQSAVVVGPGGEEIHCDEHGRVKVQFHWDRQGQWNDDSSCWIRVSHPWGGAGYGGMFIPRVGQEVLVQFLEGDPDRPVIVGRVYNGENPVPHGLPDTKNISTIRTASTPGGTGFHEIRLNDTAGMEEMFVHAQKDRNEIIGNNNTCRVAANHILQIGANKTVQVGANESNIVQGSMVLQAGNEIILMVGSSTIHITSTGISIGSSSLSLEAEQADVAAANISMNGFVKIN